MKPILAAIAAAAFVITALNIPAPAFAACYDDRTAAILSAMGALDPDNAAHFTKSGKPKVAAVETVAGIDTNAKERDAVWAEFPAWQEAQAAENERTKALAETESAFANARAQNKRINAALDDATAERDRHRSAAREAQSQHVRTNRALNLIREKYRAVSDGAQPCASLADALADSVGRWYAGKDEAKRLVACLRAG